jgi:CHASE3 domain sensor protein
MNWFRNLKTGTKLFVGFGTVIVLLAIIIVIAYSAITAIRDSQRDLFERDFTIVEDLVQLKADLNRQRADIQQMMLTTNRAEQETIEKDIKDRSSEAERIMQKLFKVNQSDPNFFRRLEDRSA